MKKFVTVTGIKHYYGHSAFEKGMKLILTKEPDNEYDKEAIKVEKKGLGKVGYIANSSYSVLGECMSAGRIYDKIGETDIVKVKYILPQGIICKVLKDKKSDVVVDEDNEIET